MPEGERAERKCIGVLIAKPDRQYQTELLCGIYRAAFERDMNVAVFGSTLAGGVTSARESELDIFTLPNYDRLSGVIYLPDAFDYEHTDEMITKPLLRAVKERGLRAVIIDYDIEGLPSVICDDSETIRALMEHAIDCHGCRDIAFMTGMKGHPHAESRLNVYREIMSENKLEILPGREYYGDFWYNEGENFVEQLKNSRDGMPDAIVCANGPMACSVYKALRKSGYSVPRDVILECYTDEPGPFKFITSSLKQADIAGYSACKKLTEIMDGGGAGGSERIKCGFKLNKSLTCGCLPAEDYDYAKMDGIDINEPQSYFSEFNFMSTELLSRPGYREMFWALDWYTTYIRDICGIYFCLCDSWSKPCNDDELKSRVGYTEKMQLYYYRVNHSDGTHISEFENEIYFPVSEMFPKIFDVSGEPSSYIFRPLHFAEKSFGYIVIDNGGKLKTYDISFDYWLKDVANAMEFQRRLGNEKFLYSSDFMTGAINRNGFNSMMPGLIEEARGGGFQLLFAVCDLNGLKYINDTYGHVEGDNSIKTAAAVLSEYKFEGLSVEKNFRIGGDEFVKTAIGRFSYRDMDAFKSSIYDRLDEYNRSSGKPYPVHLSIGVIVKEPEDMFTPDSLISEADKVMFEEKLRLKKETGFDPKRV